MSPTFMQAVVAGDVAAAEAEAGIVLPADFMAHSWNHLRNRLRMVRAEPGALPWLTRLLVLRDSNECVGHAGFHEPPRPGRDWVEVGYTVFPEHRRQGYAEEAVRGLFDWAATQRVHRFRASVGPWNQPSLNLVHKLGFVQTGTQVDEIDGEELVFETDWA